jgi:hypothetical protein
MDGAAKLVAADSSWRVLAMVAQSHLEALRAMLVGDSERFEAASDHIAKSGEYQRWGLLVAPAFCVALRSRFSAGYTNSDVIDIAEGVGFMWRTYKRRRAKSGRNR